MDTKHELAFFREFRGEVFRDRFEVLLFVESLLEELAEFRIDGIRVVVAQEAEAQIDFLFDGRAVEVGEGREYLDEGSQESVAIGDRSRLFAEAAEPAGGVTGEGRENPHGGFQCGLQGATVGRSVHCRRGASVFSVVFERRGAGEEIVGSGTTKGSG